jgi:hypothetical protein
MRYLRTNTATRVGVGPFLSASDGITPMTALTVTSCKLTMVVDTGGVPTLVLDTNPTASGGNNDMVHVAGDDAGMYDLELAAANVNYLGRARVLLTDATNHCPVWEDFMILPAMIYDSLVLGTDRFDTNVTHVADTLQTAGDFGALLALINGKTTNLPPDPADASDITALIAALPTAIQIVDALLARNAAGGSNSAPTVSTMLLTNDLKFGIVGSTLTVYAHDGVTPLYTRTLARSPLDAVVSAG